MGKGTWFFFLLFLTFREISGGRFQTGVHFHTRRKNQIASSFYARSNFICFSCGLESEGARRGKAEEAFLFPGKHGCGEDRDFFGRMSRGLDKKMIFIL